MIPTIDFATLAEVFLIGVALGAFGMTALFVCVLSKKERRAAGKPLKVETV